MTTRDRGKLPLEGLRVIDFGQIFAMPYCGALLGDLGAEIIKIEAPMRVDARRSPDGAIAGTFQMLHRGKKSLSLDLTKPQGIEVVKKLVAVSDIVIENFTPRVMRNFGLHHEELVKINPRIIMVSNCGYGSSGPWGPLPAQGTALEGTMGIINYTGYPDSPSKVGASYPDFLAAWTGLTMILAALNHVHRTGQGQWIDQSMYQIGVSLIPEPILQYQLDGKDYERIGNHDRWKAPSNVYQTKGDDEWLALSIDSDEQWQRFAKIMARPELAEDSRFATVPDRKNNEVDLDKIVGQWAAGQDRMEATKLLQAEGIPASAVMHTAELVFDEHMQHRRFYEPVDYGDEIGRRPLMGRPYRTTTTDPRIKGPAPEFADSNRYVLKEILDYDDTAIDALYAEGVLADEPTGSRMTARGGASAAAAPAATAPRTDQRQDEDFAAKLQAAYGGNKGAL